MKKLLIHLIKKYYKAILDIWVDKILLSFGNKFSKSQITIFVESSLHTILEVIDTSDYTVADQYLIDNYNLFTKINLSLLEVSQVFSYGRYAIITYIDNDESSSIDPIILIGFIDEIIEQIYARYGVLHQEVQMKELAVDRDRIAAKLETNQQYLSNVLDSSDSAIMVIDKNERIVSWNEGAERIFGYSEEEVLGKDSSLLLPNSKKYLDELERIKEDVKKFGSIKINETERKSKNNEILNVQLNITNLPGSNGEPSGRTVIIKDITELKRLKEQVDQSEKLAVIGQLAAGVAHEIGNPLASISSLVQILQRKSKDTFVVENLSIIKENIDRITRIVRELVDFSRPPSYEKVIIQITDIIKTALGIVKYDKRVKNVKFLTDLDDDLPKISVVPDQLLQVFVNILINALDAIEGNGTIRVNSYSNNEFIYVEIIDDGCGMEKDTVTKIFDPFYTTKEVGKGTGLGLSVSYGIIKKFHGDIIVESEKGKGSKFVVKLPISED
jgi:PAS domain S-box-containing protein